MRKFRLRYLIYTIIFINIIGFSLYFFYSNLKKVHNHFAIAEIDITNAKISPNMVQNFYGQNLVLFSGSKAAKEIATSAKVSRVKITKVLPNKLIISTTNLSAAAFKIQPSGVIFYTKGGVQTYADKNNDKLIEIAGQDAEAQFHNIIVHLNNLAVKKMVYVDRRRWNLHMHSGQVIKLPKQNYINTLNYLPNLLKLPNLTDENTILDLRAFPDKIYVTNDA